jgi:cell division protein ZapE
MILGRLLDALFARGVVFVMTSNYPPDGLYPNGLQRINFLPTIEMIKRASTSSRSTTAPTTAAHARADGDYLVPADAAAERKMAEDFRRSRRARGRAAASRCSVASRRCSARRRA